MKEWFYRLRFRLAYWICPEFVDDIEERLSGLLCHTTGGLLGKTNYTLQGMITAVDDYQQRCCDECEYYLAYRQTEEGGAERIIFKTNTLKDKNHFNIPTWGTSCNCCI